MELALLVWAISMLKGAITLLVVIGVIFTLICLGYFMHKMDYGSSPIVYRWPLLYAGIALMSFSLANAIPNEKTAYVMVAAYATQKIAQNPATEEIGGKVLTIINQKLDSYIDNPDEK